MSVLEVNSSTDSQPTTGIVQWGENSLDKLIETVGVNPADVLAEAAKRSIPVAGSTLPERLASLQDAEVRRLDKLARSYVRSNSQIAGAQGFVTGLAGIITMPVTVPADTVGFLVWLIRATTGVMYSYGFESESEEGKVQLRLGLLASAGVSKLTVSGSNILVTQVAKQVMSRPYREAVVQATVKALAGRAGIPLGHRHFAKMVPLFGGFINGSVNSGLVYGFSRRAQTHYRSLLLEGLEPLSNTGQDRWRAMPFPSAGGASAPPTFGAAFHGIYSEQRRRTVARKIHASARMSVRIR